MILIGLRFRITSHYDKFTLTSIYSNLLRIKDGLPKLKDVPKEMGNSGVAVAE